jgi:hypothetical protein
MIALRQAHDPAGKSAILHAMCAIGGCFAGMWRISRHLMAVCVDL